MSIPGPIYVLFFCHSVKCTLHPSRSPGHREVMTQYDPNFSIQMSHTSETQGRYFVPLQTKAVLARARSLAQLRRSRDGCRVRLVTYSQRYLEQHVWSFTHPQPTQSPRLRHQPYSTLPPNTAKSVVGNGEVPPTLPNPSTLSPHPTSNPLTQASPSGQHQPNSTPALPNPNYWIGKLFIVFLISTHLI